VSDAEIARLVLSPLHPAENDAPRCSLKLGARGGGAVRTPDRLRAGTACRRRRLGDDVMGTAAASVAMYARAGDAPMSVVWRPLACSGVRSGDTADVPATQILDGLDLVQLLERVPDIVWRYRLLPERGFEYVSPSVFALTGYTPAEHYADPDLGRRIAHPDDIPLLEETIRSPAAHPRVTLRWRHRRGRLFATEHRLTVVRDAHGHVVAIEGIARPVARPARATRMHAGDVVLDLAGHRALVADRVVDLTPAEHRILSSLVAADGPVSPRDLVVGLWGADHPGGTRALQVHVSNLRRKLEQDPRNPRRLLTMRGVGYVLARS
jgi:PAS domain-containing protein